MRYETLSGIVVKYYDYLSYDSKYPPLYSTYFNRNDYEHLIHEREDTYYYLNDMELAEIYPEAKGYLKDKVKEYEEMLDELAVPSWAYKIKEETSNLSYPYQKEQDVITARIAHHQNQIDIIEKKIKKLKSILYFMGNKKTINTDWITKIALAKQFPIPSLLTLDRAGFAKCPFHNETNSSLKYYSKSNTYHCFGCAVGGDSIDFIMRLKGLKFLEAVDYLAH